MKISKRLQNHNLRAYSHQQNPLVSSLPDQNAIFTFWFCLVSFHIAIFRNGPRICQQTHISAKIIQSLDKKIGAGNVVKKKS